jgi:Rrf2 family iron-sulfur cluster assembly transcriptional regulator
MELSRSTRHALYAAMEMARAGQEPVTASQVARRYALPEPALAKVFQQMVRAGLAVGTRGVGGGYRLADSPRRLTVEDVIQAFAPKRPAGACLLERPARGCAGPAECRLGRLFDEVDELVRCTFASVTLETLVRGPA